MTDGAGPDDAGDASDKVVVRPALEPGMLRHGRTDGFWWRVVRRRPGAVLGAVAFPVAVAWGVQALAARVVPFDSPSLGGFVVALWVGTLPAMRRIGTGVAVEDEASGADPGRPPVDARTLPVVTASFGRGTPTARTVSVTRWGLFVVLGGIGAMLGGSELIRSWRDPDLVTLTLGAAGVVGALVLGELFAGRVRRRTRALMARGDLAPEAVRVVGLRAADDLWVLEPLDGRPRVVVGLYSGDVDLVAGDVVHAWGDIARPDGATGRRERPGRLALTGPFGTLWASEVTYDGLRPAAVR